MRSSRLERRPSARQPKGACDIPILPADTPRAITRTSARRIGRRGAVIPTARASPARSVRGSCRVRPFPRAETSANARRDASIRAIVATTRACSATRGGVQRVSGAVAVTHRAPVARRPAGGIAESSHFSRQAGRLRRVIPAISDPSQRPPPNPQVAAMTEVNTTSSSPLVGAMGKIKESAMHIFGQVRYP